MGALALDRVAAYKPQGFRPGTGTSSHRQIDVDLLVAQLPLDAMPVLIEAALQRMRDEMVPTPLATGPAREFLSVDAAAEQLSVSPKTLREAMTSRWKKGVHWHRIGGRVVIDWPALCDLVRSGGA